MTVPPPEQWNVRSVDVNQSSTWLAPGAADSSGGRISTTFQRNGNRKPRTRAGLTPGGQKCITATRLKNGQSTSRRLLARVSFLRNSQYRPPDVKEFRMSRH